MGKKSFVILGLVNLLVACSGSGSGGGSSRSALEGADLSGIWRLSEIICFDSNFENVTADGFPSTQSAEVTQTINQNQHTLELKTANCSVTSIRRMVATFEDGNVTDGGYGSMVLGPTTSTVTPTTSCSVTIGYDMSQGSLTPSSTTSTIQNGEERPEIPAVDFIMDPTFLMYFSSAEVVGRPTDICLTVYDKIIDGQNAFGNPKESKQIEQQKKLWLARKARHK